MDFHIQWGPKINLLWILRNDCMWFTNIFFDLVGCLFILMMVSFTVQKHFSLIQGLQLFSGSSCLLDSMVSKALQGLTAIFNHSTCIFPLILHREAMELAVPWMCPAVSLTSEPLHMLCLLVETPNSAPLGLASMRLQVPARRAVPFYSAPVSQHSVRPRMPCSVSLDGLFFSLTS